MKQDVINLTRDQIKRNEMLIKANAGIVTVKEAAETLGLSERQIKRLKKKVKEGGAVALIHRNTQRPSQNRITDETKAKIIELKQTEPYKRCNFKHFGELLSEHHGIEIGYSTLYSILKESGINSPKTRRRYKPHRRRKRRLQAGMLLQVDATPYAWFKGDKKQYALHGGIDDATGQITGLYMCKNECLQGYFEMMRRTIANYGVPMSLYADRHTIFQSPNKAKAEIDPKIPVNDTQFGRCLKELSVQLIAARSPQAKGRVERLWQTLQDRLPVEFAIRDITTVEAANEFLQRYIYAFNSQFAVEPENVESVFSKPHEGLNLNYVLCIKEVRTVDNGGIFSYGGKLFKVCEDIYSGFLPPNVKVNVLASPIFGLKADYRKIVYSVTPYTSSKHVTQAKTNIKPSKIPLQVPDAHYYKYGKNSLPTVIYSETDAEIMEMLYDVFFKKFV